METRFKRKYVIRVLLFVEFLLLYISKISSLVLLLPAPLKFTPFFSLYSPVESVFPVAVSALNFCPSVSVFEFFSVTRRPPGGRQGNGASNSRTGRFPCFRPALKWGLFDCLNSVNRLGEGITPSLLYTMSQCNIYISYRRKDQIWGKSV